jgi:LPXTG-motif cell wall-anchored protein
MQIAARIGIGAVVAAGAALLFAGPASAAPARSITIDPNPVALGGSYSISGTGCQPGPDGIATVTVSASDGPNDTATFAAATDGTWGGEGSVPTDNVTGTFTVTATCDTYTGSFDYSPVSLTIEAGAASTGGGTTTTTTLPATSDQLASTGSPDQNLTIIGVAGLAAGGALLYLGRRRRADHQR